MAEWTPGQGRDGSKPPFIGLTGPIGCGKSTIGRMLAELGGSVIDADALARRATGKGAPALTAIRQRFGDDVFAADGSLDRAALAAVVFNDREALADLERIVHPDVRRLVNAELERAVAEEAPFVAVEAIKLVEGGLADRCDEVWLIECDPATQRQRLAQRGSTPDDVERRLAAQGTDLAERLAKMLGERDDRVRRLSTDGSLADVRASVEDALADLLSGALGIG